MAKRNYISEQRRLMRQIQEASINVCFGCAVKEPSVKMLKIRNWASVRLANAAVKLADSIYDQLCEKDK